ncbi:related to nicotinate-nucleotide adenylyltransferase [Desulfotalea psychrophila LSv54]|nr:related to nicotinate-nucleotide adenylyltransferase [Desulfotalea psychrophila LSv54]
MLWKKMKKIGLFGGTFNPLHNGHLQLAEFAAAQCQLDQVVFLPAASPPHKKGDEIVPFSHRAEMIRLACSRNKRFSCNTIEQDLARPSYTVDTLQALKTSPLYKSEAQFFFLIGVDAFIELKTWKAYRDLLSEINFILCPRKLFSRTQTVLFLTELGFVQTPLGWEHSSYLTLYELEGAPDQVSSTEVRRTFEKSGDLYQKLPPTVADYIMKHGLY